MRKQILQNELKKLLFFCFQERDHVHALVYNPGGKFLVFDFENHNCCGSGRKNYFLRQFENVGNIVDLLSKFTQFTLCANPGRSIRSQFGNLMAYPQWSAIIPAHCARGLVKTRFGTPNLALCFAC